MSVIGREIQNLNFPIKILLETNFRKQNIKIGKQIGILGTLIGISTNRPSSSINPFEIWEPSRRVERARTVKDVAVFDARQETDLVVRKRK